MQQNHTSKPGNDQHFPLNTDTFAERNNVKGQSVRSRICRFGHYFGIRPRKLANGRLAFPDVQVTA